MRCAVSFLSVLVLTTGVGIAAFFIIWFSKPSTAPECGEEQWQCPEDYSCISSQLRCNGRHDCPRGLDENQMACNDMNGTFESIIRIHDCGRNKTKTLVDYEYPEGCNKTDKATYCRYTRLTSVPWDRLDLHATILSLSNVFDLEELTNELIPPANNTINRLYVENNTIVSLGKSSICNWEHACWMTFTNNSIQNISPGAFCQHPKLKWLTISHNNLTLGNFEFPQMESLLDLVLEHNNIEEINDKLFSQLGELVSLNLIGNRIKTVNERAFQNNLNLQKLYLSDNLLKQLPPLFNGTNSLVRLYIEENPFKNLSGEVFSQLEVLASLNLEGIEESAIDFNALNKLPRLDYVSFEKFSYCRYVPKVTRCYPFSDGMSSIINLLAETPVRCIVWVVALLTIVGNSIVLITRCCCNDRGRILDVFINNLAGADFLMGLYLITLAIKDIQYRNVYYEHAYKWSTSLLCSGIGIIAMISCEVSLLILTFMSVERYLVISDPFSYHRKLSLNLSRLSMLIIWIFVTILAIAPAIQWRGKFSFYGSSGLCFPVHLDEPFGIGWQYTCFVIVGLNSVCLIIVAVSYSKLFCVIRTTRLSTPVDTKDIEMAVRFFLMVFTDCLCWLPIILLKIYALCGHQIPKEFITWVVIFVLPINSTINPFLYTLSMPETRIKLFGRFIPTSAIRQSMNIITLALRRQGRSTEAEESRDNWDTNTSNTTNATHTTSDHKVAVRKNRLSYQESIASSKLEDTL